jgi:hypothetical protein
VCLGIPEKEGMSEEGIDRLYTSVPKKEKKERKVGQGI